MKSTIGISNQDLENLENILKKFNSLLDNSDGELKISIKKPLLIEDFKIYRSNNFALNLNIHDFPRCFEIYLFLKQSSKFYGKFGCGCNNFIPEHGVDCVYMSLILKDILKKRFNLDTKLIQGFFKFKHNPIARMVFGEYGIGFHSWLYSEEFGVMDSVFITQQGNSMNLQLSDSVIFGEFNDKEITFVGTIEESLIDQDYYKSLFMEVNPLNKDSFEESVLEIEKEIEKIKLLNLKI